MRAKGSMRKYLDVRRKVEKEIASGGKEEAIGRLIGKHREFLVIKILEALKREGIIRDFIAPGNLSYSDLERGIDVFVVKVGESKYHVIPLSVTGKAWAAKHMEKHPEIPVIEIGFKDKYDAIKEKVEKEIRQYI